MIYIENSYTKLSLNDIKEFESKIGMQLPDDYKAFLFNQNGGKPNPRRYRTKDGKIESSIMMFLPLADIESSNLLYNFNLFNKRNLLPENLIPIGETPRKYQICLSLKGKDAGFVYHWFWEDEEEGFKGSYDNMYLIAQSFTKFIDCLYDPNN